MNFSWCLQVQMPKSRSTINLAHWEGHIREAIAFGQMIHAEFDCRAWLYRTGSDRPELMASWPYDPAKGFSASLGGKAWRDPEEEETRAHPAGE